MKKYKETLIMCDVRKAVEDGRLLEASPRHRSWIIELSGWDGGVRAAKFSGSDASI